MKKRKQINLETDALCVLSKLIQFHEDYIWTLRIMSHFLCWDFARIEKAMKWLLNNGLAYKDRGSYARTEQGVEYYEETMRKPDIQINLQTWKNEVLTGVKQHDCEDKHPDWQRSEIDNGVLPHLGNSNIGYKQNSEEIMLLKEQAKIREREAAQMCGVNLKEFRRLLRQKRIALCKGYDGKQHVGIFHRSGKRLQNFCIECRKKRRKEK